MAILGHVFGGKFKFKKFIRFSGFLLRTIHPNPGLRNKTAEGKAMRNQRRYEKRVRREERLRLKMVVRKDFRIVTWNVFRDL